MRKARVTAGFLLLGILFAGAGPVSAQEEGGGVPIREVVIGMASRIIRMNPSPDVVGVMRNLIVTVSRMDQAQLGPAGGRSTGTTRTDPYRSDPYGSDPYRSDPYRSDPYRSDPYRSDPYSDDEYRSTTSTGTSGRMAIGGSRRMTGADMGHLYTVYKMLLEYHRNFRDRETRAVFLDIIQELTQLLGEEVEERSAPDRDDAADGVEDFF